MLHSKYLNLVHNILHRNCFLIETLCICMWFSWPESYYVAQSENVLRVKPELPSLTGHADWTMEGKTCLEFPSGLQNITFNLMFVFKGTGHSCVESCGLIENLESFHFIYKGSEWVIWYWVIIGTAVESVGV